MKTIFAALASAALLAAPMASISTPAAAQIHGGGFHASAGFRGGGGFHGGGGFRGGSYGGGFRGGQHRDRGEGILFDAPFVDPYYFADPYYYDDGEAYDDSSQSCGSWAWDAVHGGYVWIPC